MARPALHRAEDWIAAGWRALGRGGPAAVRIEALARDLGVTKGSCYGYFADRAALLDAMLAQWRERSGGALIARVEAQRGTPQQRLWALIETVIREGARSPEPALRGWGRSDPAIRAALEALDRQRLGYLDGLFRAMGFASADANVRARLCYLALIAEHQLGLAASLEERLAAGRAQFALLTRA
jgi:AcrR family transcriptional regulator